MILDWQIADDPQVIHHLIETSDQRAATISGTTSPKRQLEATRWLVSNGLVHVGLSSGHAAATVTVNPTPPFDLELADLPHAGAPLYMQRLAVDPDAPDKLLGLQAIRYAIKIATAAGADALRAEANPDLTNVLRMLTSTGFDRFRTDESGAARRTFLQRALPS